MMKSKLLPGLAAASAALAAVSAHAALPTPPIGQAQTNAQAYLFHGGAGDIFEITTSTMAIQRSQNPQVRAFATGLIGDHTQLTNTALATARGAGVMPPPPELSPQQKAQITQLISASPAAFDRVYLQQQVPAHQQALALQRGYAARGDTPALRQAASAAVPRIEGHLAEAQRLLRTVR